MFKAFATLTQLVKVHAVPGIIFMVRSWIPYEVTGCLKHFRDSLITSLQTWCIVHCPTSRKGCNTKSIRPQGCKVTLKPLIIALGFHPQCFNRLVGSRLYALTDEFTASTYSNFMFGVLTFSLS